MQATLEKARQSLRVGDRTFKPTPNIRIPAMLAEADDFAVQMQSFQAALKRYQVHVGGILKALPVICKSNLPRVWDRVEGGLCEPIRATVSHQHPNRIGGDFDEALLRDTHEIMDDSLNNDILAPIDRWLESLAVIKSRMSKLESLRLEVDARRRRMHHKHQAHLKQLERRTRGRNMPHRDVTYDTTTPAAEATTPTTTTTTPTAGGMMAGGSMSAAGPSAGTTGTRLAERQQELGLPTSPIGTGEGALVGASGADNEYDDYDIGGAGDPTRAVRTREDVLRDMMYDQRKLDAVQQSYIEQEGVVWEQLSGLVRDTAWLKSYVAGAINIIREALQASAIGMGPCKLPLPAYSQGAFTEPHGKVGSPANIINSVPEGATAGVSGLLTSGKTPPAMELRASRLTAQPLETSADKETPRYGPVPPVVKGASHLPAEDVTSTTYQALRNEVEGAAGTTGGLTGKALTAGGV